MKMMWEKFWIGHVSEIFSKSWFTSQHKILLAQKDVVLYYRPKVQIMIHHDYLILKAFQVLLKFEKQEH
jgi:hypothetical protein